MPRGGIKRGVVYLGTATPDRKERKAFLRNQRRAEIDPDALNRLRALRQILEHEAALLDEAVVQAIKDQERTWAEVGEAFGMTREAVHQRFAKRLGLTGINGPGPKKG